MSESKRARVGLLGLTLELYDGLPELKPRLAEFARELVGVMAPFADVDFPGVVNTREQVDEAMAGFEADRKDLVIVVLLSYAESHIALPALVHTPLPVLLFNTQRLEAVTPSTTSWETTENHGMHGVQDLANVVLRSGKSIQIVTGHYKDPRALAQVQAWCDAARTATFARKMRIGLVGYPMEGMGDFGIDHTAFLSQLGASVVHVPMKGLADIAAAAPQDEVAAQMAEDRRLFQFQEGITTREHEASSRLEWAMRNVVRERNLQGFASHFIANSEEGWLDTLPFLAASKMLADGYGFGGEGDVTSAAAVALMHELAGAANFTEMFTMDYVGNAALMMHMGEGNWKMARRDEPIHLLKSALGLVPVRVDPLLLAFSLEPGVVTLVSLTTVADGKLKFIVTEGQVLDFPYLPDLARPHYKFGPEGDLSDFLTRFSLAGGSHHQALAYGRWSATVDRLGTLLGIECVRV